MPRRKFAWEKLSDEELLKQRLSSLRVAIDGTWLEDCLNALQEELDARDIRLRPHTWVSSEWFSPAGVPGVAIPFYLGRARRGGGGGGGGRGGGGGAGAGGGAGRRHEAG